MVKPCKPSLLAGSPKNFRRETDPPMLPIGEWNSVDQDFSHLDRDELQGAQG